MHKSALRNVGTRLRSLRLHIRALYQNPITLQIQNHGFLHKIHVLKLSRAFRSLHLLLESRAIQQAENDGSWSAWEPAIWCWLNCCSSANAKLCGPPRKEDRNPKPVRCSIPWMSSHEGGYSAAGMGKLESATSCTESWTRWSTPERCGHTPQS